jgi:adenine-specific DNA-methyltransferase
VERLVLALTNPGDLVLDPYMGVGSSLIAAILNNRRCAGADIAGEYVSIAGKRIAAAVAGTLKTRPRNRPIYEPPQGCTLTTKWWKEDQNV